MATYFAKTGDAGSTTPDTFLEKGNGTPVNLTGATVKFIMREIGAGSAKVNAAATVVDAATGQVRYSWTTNDLDTPSSYQAEWEVTYSGGAKETFPADGYIYVVIRDDLDP
jgi:hypothetical protein